jgi:DnaK suppressor protein
VFRLYYPSTLAQEKEMTTDVLHGFSLVLKQTLELARMSLVQGTEALSGTEAALPDQVDRAAMESGRNFALLLSERDRRTRDDALRALERIKSGEYGVCLDCGEDIPLVRLHAKPTAELCAECQTRVDDEFGRIAHLGGGLPGLEWSMR